MHEMSYVRPLVETILEECARNNVREVRRINLSIGEMLDMVEEYIPGLVCFLGRGTPIENAEVRIARVPFYVRCIDCGDIFKIDVRAEETWRCPRCGAHRRYRIFSGRELRLDSIEVAAEKPLDEGSSGRLPA